MSAIQEAAANSSSGSGEVSTQDDHGCFYDCVDWWENLKEKEKIIKELKEAHG